MICVQVNEDLDSGLVGLDAHDQQLGVSSMQMLVPSSAVGASWQRSLGDTGMQVVGPDGVPGSGGRQDSGAPTTAVSLTSAAWVEARTIVERCRHELLAQREGGGGEERGGGGKEGGGEATGEGLSGEHANWLQQLITGAVSCLLVMQQCSSRGLAPSTACESLDSMLLFLHPHADANAALFSKVRETVARIKATIAL